MNARVKKSLKFAMRWGIAIVGVYWVCTKITLHDQVLYLENGKVQMASLAQPPAPIDSRREYVITNPVSGQPRAIPAASVVNQPDPKEAVLKDGTTVKVLGLDLPEKHLEHNVAPNRLLIEGPGGQPAWIAPDQTVGYGVRVPYPRVQIGLIGMVRMADVALLLAAIAVMPVTFLLTAYRWHELLKALDITVSSARTFTLNMVGAFYSTFLPGSTGGDVLKAYYASLHTLHRTRAVMSVFVDRIIGLLALIIFGGVMAATQWSLPAARKIAIGSAGIVAITAFGLLIFYNPLLRRISGLNFILKRLPMQKQINNAIQVMEIYRGRPFLVLWSLIVSFPVHATVVISASLAGIAFQLPLPLLYYWAIVPVIVLAGAIPISPQGAGVMEAFAVLLTQHRGCSVGQAVALTMSIRLVQILWNLVGGIFVLRGGYHAPTQAEAAEVAQAQESTAAE